MKLSRTAVVICMVCVGVLSPCRASAADKDVSLKEEKLKKAKDYYQQGKKALQQGNYSQANEFFAKAELVLGRDFEGDVDAASGSAAGTDAAAQAAPVYPPGFYYNLGLEHLRRGNFKLAEEAFLKVLSLKPDDPEACYNLGVLYENYLNDPAQACKYYLRYVNLVPDADDASQVKSWIDALQAQNKGTWTTSN